MHASICRVEVQTNFSSAQSSQDGVLTIKRPWPAKFGSFFPYDDTARGQFASPATCDHYHLYCLFEGHCGPAAAQFCPEAVVRILEAHLPPLHLHGTFAGAAVQTGEAAAAPPRVAAADGGKPIKLAGRVWEGMLQAALLQTVVDLHVEFGSLGNTGGCTATIVLQVGRLLTCASLGGPRAVVHPVGGELVELSVDHRLESNWRERARLRQAGIQLGGCEGSGAAPQGRSRGRQDAAIWPAWLSTARSIGDFSVGEAVLPLPHLRQVLVPESGGRIVLATHSVWGHSALALSQVQEVLLEAQLPMCPHQVMDLLEQKYGAQRDMAVVVVDVISTGAEAGATGGSGGGATYSKGSLVTTADDAAQELEAKKGLSFRKFFRHKPAAPQQSQQELHLPPAAATQQAVQLLSDLDTAHLMGLTLEQPPDDPPAWFTLQLMSQIHRSMKYARMDWQAARWTAAELQSTAALWEARAGGEAPLNHGNINKQSLSRASSSSSSSASSSSTSSMHSVPLTPRGRDLEGRWARQQDSQGLAGTQCHAGHAVHAGPLQSAPSPHGAAALPATSVTESLLPSSFGKPRVPPCYSPSPGPSAATSPHQQSTDGLPPQTPQDSPLLLRSVSAAGMLERASSGASSHSVCSLGSSTSGSVDPSQGQSRRATVLVMAGEVQHLPGSFHCAPHSSACLQPSETPLRKASPSANGNVGSRRLDCSSKGSRYGVDSSGSYEAHAANASCEGEQGVEVLVASCPTLQLFYKNAEERMSRKCSSRSFNCHLLAPI